MWRVAKNFIAPFDESRGDLKKTSPPSIMNNNGFMNVSIAIESSLRPLFILTMTTSTCGMLNKHFMNIGETHF